MAWTLSLVLVLLLHSVPSAVSLSWIPTKDPPVYNHYVDLPTTKPLIIAHRGSSGIIPEHTVEAYKKAIDQGADIIECDVAVTKDLQFICAHDNWIGGSTNVDEKFPDRLSTRYITDERRNVTNYFTVDFTLSEIKTLRAKQSFSYRDQRLNGLYEISTFEEYIKVAKDAGRPVGIYPETKQPTWVNEMENMKNANTTFEKLLVGILQRHGYSKRSDPCFLQSFTQQSLDDLRALTDLPLVFLLKADNILTETDLDNFSKNYYGIGLNKRLIVKTGSDGAISSVTDLIEKAHKFGLKVHPYTFRNEDRQLAWDYEQDPYNEMKQFLDLGVDGYFTDFPATCADFLNMSYSKSTAVSNGARPFESAKFSLCVYAIVMISLVTGIMY